MTPMQFRAEQKTEMPALLEYAGGCTGRGFCAIIALIIFHAHDNGE